MLILQIDSLSQLKNDQGFWDNFIWPIAVAVVLAIGTLVWKLFAKFWNRFYFVEQNKAVLKTKAKVSEKIECVTVSSFSALCQQLFKLLDDNKYIFKTFGPNSSANEVTPLRVDLTLWRNARSEYILPNNEAIRCIIENNKSFIPEHYKVVFQKLISHIYAFKKHVEEPTFDYSEYQFPSQIEGIVKRECFVSNQKK